MLTENASRGGATRRVTPPVKYAARSGVYNSVLFFLHTRSGLKGLLFRHALC